MKLISDLLDHKVGAEEAYSSLDEINFEERGFNLVQISLPGEYAAKEAEKAISYGCDVFIFSDNVPLVDERRLKELGREKGCLVMGPDCGVALIDGVALGAGSIVRRGAIGIVGCRGKRCAGSGLHHRKMRIRRFGYHSEQAAGICFRRSAV